MKEPTTLAAHSRHAISMIPSSDVRVLASSGTDKTVGPRSAVLREAMALLDEAAWLTEAGETAFGCVRSIHEGEESLRVPPVVKRQSPVVGLQRAGLVV